MPELVDEQKNLYLLYYTATFKFFEIEYLALGPYETLKEAVIAAENQMLETCGVKKWENIVTLDRFKI